MEKRGVCVCAAIFVGFSASLIGCGKQDNAALLADVVYRESYESVYGKIGKEITIADVREDERGLAYALYEGEEYELGMDFLSMAMVYNTRPVGAFPTAKAAYEEWWRLFMQRWNYLAPEIPLYSNQYYDIYNGKIDGLKTGPFYSVTSAIVGAKVVRGSNSVVLGSNTELSGAFRRAAFGKSSAGAADLAIEELTNGYSTVITDELGEYSWSESVLDWRAEKENADGTKTFTLKIAEDLTFSDGTPIRAENYLVELLVGSSKVMKEAGGSDGAGLALVGYRAFHDYEGEGDPVPFSGVRLLDEYTFSVTVDKEYADYYYAIRYGAFSPLPTALYVGRYALKDDGEGAYIEKGFYNKTKKDGAWSYDAAGKITENLSKLSEKDFPYSGPYIVESYDRATRVATLKRNGRYKGDHRGVATIDKISYVKIVSETQLDQLKKGRVDVLASVTGGEETKAALALVDGVKFKETHYDRAGYGKLAFRCDFGPTQFAEVRRAVMHTIDRDEFAQVFTGGYGTVVHAPYHAGSEAYHAVKDSLKLNKYEYSVEKAKTELKNGGWIYDKRGRAYDEKKAEYDIKG